VKLEIDNLTSITDWVVNAPSTIEAIAEKKYIAGLNDTALMIKFDSADTVKTATKTYSTPFDVSDYETLVFSIWSQRLGISKDYLKTSDFAYQINIDGVTDFYIPAYETFTDIEIGIEDIDSITQIKITALHSITDYIIISEMIAEKEQTSLDIMEAVKDTIEYWMEKVYPSGELLGTVSTTTGDTSITMSNPAHLNRYAVIKIDDNTNSEIHQIDECNGAVYNLKSNFDGGGILNTFVNANVYLIYPVMINPGQFEIRLPGFSVWGIAPEPFLRGSKFDTIRDSFTDSTSKERQEGQLLRYSIKIDCEARSYGLITKMTKILRRLIALEVLWANGRKHDIFFGAPPIELRPTEAIDIIPKVQYTLEVEVKENINDRKAVPVTTAINITSNIQEG
jgi:hypothetical protein